MEINPGEIIFIIKKGSKNRVFFILCSDEIRWNMFLIITTDYNKFLYMKLEKYNWDCNVAKKCNVAKRKNTNLMGRQQYFGIYIWCFI